MRHAQFLIESGLATQPNGPYSMPVKKSKKGIRWPLNPGGVIEPHPHSHNDGGNKPEGFISKHKRFKHEPPGFPQGACLKGTARANDCHCGGHLYRR